MKPRPKNSRGRKGGGGDDGGVRREGLVTTRGRRHAVVDCDDGSRLRCEYDDALFDAESPFTHPVAAGDRATTVEGRRGARIVEVGPRKGRLSRMRGKKEQVIVANVDRVLIVASAASPRFRPRLVDRMIVAAERAGFEPVVVVNKVDLAEDRTTFEETRDLYRGLGYRSYLVSADSGEGVDDVRAVVAKGITAATGPSGVGKTTLLNLINPGLGAATAPISKRWGKGVHTTTRVVLHPLGDGAFYADTPGVRTFDVAGLAAPDVAMLFREFTPYIDACRFNSCSHDHEPECAVKAAVLSGGISERRYESFLRIIRGDDDFEPGDDDGDDAIEEGDAEAE